MPYGFNEDRSKEDLSELVGEIPTIQSNLEDTIENVGNLSDEVEALTDDVEGLKEAAADLKSKFIVVSGTVSSVGKLATKARSYSASQLAALGIDDVTKWVVISAMTDLSRGIWQTANTGDGGNPISVAVNVIEASKGMDVAVTNGLSSTKNIKYKVALMRA